VTCDCQGDFSNASVVGSFEDSGLDDGRAETAMELSRPIIVDRAGPFAQVLFES
jgi:hypothetical protein